MNVDKEKVNFYLRITFCIALIGIWSLWVTTLPKTETSKKFASKKEIANDVPDKTPKEDTNKFAELENKTEKLTEASSKENPTEKVNTKTEAKPIKTEILKETEFPKFAKLESNMVIKEQSKEESKQIANKNTVSQSNIKKKEEQTVDLNLPKIAQATRKALSNSTSRAKEQKINLDNMATLRNKAYSDNLEIKALAQNIINSDTVNEPEDELETSWLPRYIVEKAQVIKNLESAVNNLDKIASQVELAGLIKNEAGASAAIIRNKANNKIEILKQGEEFQGLKLLEINQTEIKLGNQELNKTYSKKIASKRN